MPGTEEEVHGISFETGRDLSKGCRGQLKAEIPGGGAVKQRQTVTKDNLLNETRIHAPKW